MSGAASRDEQFLYLTTTGRTTGLPREIEIWYVTAGGRYYVLAEHGERAHWVRNVAHTPRVTIRVGRRDASTITATARVLDEERDAGLWQSTRQLAQDKYGWGGGMPVEIAPDDADS